MLRPIEDPDIQKSEPAARVPDDPPHSDWTDVSQLRRHDVRRNEYPVHVKAVEKARNVSLYARNIYLENWRWPLLCLCLFPKIGDETKIDTLACPEIPDLPPNR